MKRIIAAALALACLLSALRLASCSKEKIITVGDETLTLPANTKHINYSTPKTFECIYTENGTEYDLYSANLEELRLLSMYEWDTKYPDLEDKQTVAEISAAIFAELFPEKEIAHNEADITIKLNPVAKCLICRGEGNDGKFATLALNRKSGEIVMITYGD